MSKTLIITLIFSATLHSVLSQTENICETECAFCCRDRQCRSKEDCESGDFSAFVIAGIIAGSLVGLCLLRWLCKKYMAKMKANQSKNKDKKKSGSSWR
mmetsp:Transcript_19209/g.16482  ORF Transcript_19209/g.16482 Transcript_19209/m.16482 type:complete len:99 (+) Transcript_19209:87-383(+)